MPSVLYARFAGPIASFRYPYLTIGNQLSYPLPPLSTLYGLLCAAYGKPFPPEQLAVGYLFHAEPHSSSDLEKLWFIVLEEKKSKDPSAPKEYRIKEFKSNVLRRELRVSCTLELFLQPKDPEDLPLWKEVLRRPYFWLSLGRSQEILSIEEVQEVEAEPLASEMKSPLYAGPSLYPYSWREHLRALLSAQRLPFSIPPVTRAPVVWGYFLEVTFPLALQSLPPPENAYLVPTRLPGPTDKRVIYLWNLDPASLPTESLRIEWPQP